MRYKRIAVMLLAIITLISVAYLNIGGCSNDTNCHFFFFGGSEQECSVEANVRSCNTFEFNEDDGKCELLGCNRCSPSPTNPPPTNPPSQCQVPALDTDFSDLLFFFIDVPNNVLIGVTSDGEEVIIALADIEVDPVIIGLFAIPIGPNVAVIDAAVIEELLGEATGDAVRVDNGSVFQIIDLILAGIPLAFDLEGECDSVEPLVTTSTETLRNVLLNMKTRGLLEEDGSGDSANHIKNFADKLLPPQE
jgi:hypothetical protein